jgi:hypothetical protein
MAGCSSSGTNGPTKTGHFLRSYTQDEKEYFLDVAFGSEYLESSEVIRKWARPIKIGVDGSYNDEDLATLKDVINELNELSNSINISLSLLNKSDVIIYFGPESNFNTYVPEDWENFISEPLYEPYSHNPYIPNNGFVTCWDDTRGKFIRAIVLISTTNITQAERNHIIRELIAKMLGLMKNSNRYDNSIFYGRNSTTYSWDEYSDMDKAIISMLYDDRIKPGMTKDEALSALA